MDQIKKVVIPVAGLGTRFLPLSKVLPKEFWPLIDKPVVHYILEEAQKSGIQKTIFIVRREHKIIKEYFRRRPDLEKILKQNDRGELLTELETASNLVRGLSFSFAVQKKPLGDGHAVLTAKRFVGKEPFGVLFADDVVIGKTPCLAQLIKVFKTCQKPTVALEKIPKEGLHKYGVVQVERIAHRLYKIRKIIEKPTLSEAPSDLAIVGRYILTPEIFEYLKKDGAKFHTGEIILARALNAMVSEGKIVYGYEFEGNWLECGKKEDWLKSNLYLASRNPHYGKILKEYLKTIK